MKQDFFSLIYKNKDAKEPLAFSNINETVKQLDAGWLLYARNTDWINFVTDDIETIRHREEAFSDILACPALSDLCDDCAEKLSAIDGLRRIKETQHTNETMLYSIKDSSYILVSDGSIDCGSLVKEYASFYKGKGGGNKVSARGIFTSREDAEMFADLIQKHLK